MDRIPDHIGIYPLSSEMNMDVLTGFSLMCKMRGCKH